MTRHYRTSKAFTLIELLVVIAIIALLIGILLPSLGSARDAGRSAVCLANLSQIGIGFQSYANDWDDRLPPHSYADEKLITPTGLPGAKVAWCAAEVPGEPSDVFAASFIGPYLDGVERIGGCPSWDPPEEYLDALHAFTGFPKLPPIDYAYNGRMLGVPGPAGPARWIGFRLSEVRNPAKTVLVTDAAIYERQNDRLVFSLEFELQPPVADTYSRRRGSSPDSSEGTVHGRHRGKANTAWADGHASSEQVRLEESPEPQAQLLLGDLFAGDSANNDWWDAGFGR